MTTLIEAMQLIRDDCEADSLALEGKPFNGRTVSEALGAMLAMIDALAHAVQLLAERQAE
jgi:hypothetical protein